MNTFIWVVIVAVIVFLLTYNPEKGALNTMLAGELGIKAPVPACCADDTYRAKNPKRCEAPHYNGVQFADPNYTCPIGPEQSALGAIITK